jgi:hypothetical protein
MAIRAVVETVQIVAQDTSSDKWVAHATTTITDSVGQTTRQIDTHVAVAWPILATTLRAALTTQIVADALSAGYTLLAINIIFPDATLA